MALDKAALKTELKAAFQNAVGVDDDFDTFAQAVADAIDKYTKTGSVVGVQPGGSTIQVT